MTRARKSKDLTHPLSEQVRAALAQGWHTLDALEALAGRVPAARHRVHAALAELRAGGCALEERVTRGVAEVRLGPATLPAPVPDDHRADLAATIVDLAREAAEMGVEDDHGWAEALDSLDLSEEEAERMRPVWTSAQDAWRRERVEGERASAAPSEPAPRLDAPAPPCEPSAPVEAADGAATGARAATDPLFVQCPICKADPGHPCKRLGGKSHPSRGDDAEAWAREQEGEPSATPFDHPPAPRQPGPSSRCAVCGAAYKRHAEGGATKPAPGTCSAFKALPRGRPPVERPCDGVAPAAPSPALDAAASEPDACPPCIDCGEERGSCPEGRCRDCDIEHGMSAGACRECHTWIIREDMGGPLAKQHAKGCSLADSDDWHPRNAAEYAAVRTARYGWAPEPRRGCECEFPVVRVAPIIIAAPRPVGRCRPPQCHADDIHEPGRVRGFARPLCERHRRWVEGAGGTVAAGGLAGVVEQVRAASPSTPPDLRAFRRSGYTTGPLIPCEHAGMGNRGRCAEGEMDGHLVVCETDQGVEGVVVYVPVGETWDAGAMRAEILAAVRGTLP